MDLEYCRDLMHVSIDLAMTLLLQSRRRQPKLLRYGPKCAPDWVKCLYCFLMKTESTASRNIAIPVSKDALGAAAKVRRNVALLP